MAHLLFRDRAELRRYLDRACIAATTGDPHAEPLPEEQRAERVLAVLRESGAISQS